MFLIKIFVKNFNNTDSPDVRYAYGKVASIIAIICNVLLFFAKLIVSIISSSIAISADAINNLSDASSGIISLIGFKMAEKPADAKHPYGHGRYEYIAALCVAVIVILIGIELLKTSIEKIISPKNIDFGIGTIVVLSISIIIKVFLMYFNRKCGKIIKSNALLATATDSRNDCISTAAVLFAAIISEATNIELDGWIALGVSLFILISGYKLIKETFDPILGSVPDINLIMKIKDKIMSYPKVLGVHDLIIHDYGPTRKFASVHVEMDGEDSVYENHEIIDSIEAYFLKKEGLNIIIHYDPIPTSDPLLLKLKIAVEKIVNNLNPQLSIHDFRITHSDKKTKLIFDMLIPHSVEVEKENLIERICIEVKKIDENYECLIYVDEYFTD